MNWIDLIWIVFISVGVSIVVSVPLAILDYRRTDKQLTRIENILGIKNNP